MASNRFAAISVTNMQVGLYRGGVTTGMKLTAGGGTGVGAREKTGRGLGRALGQQQRCEQMASP
jgi:hypothetical protein